MRVKPEEKARQHFEELMRIVSSISKKPSKDIDIKILVYGPMSKEDALVVAEKLKYIVGGEDVNDNNSDGVSWWGIRKKFNPSQSVVFYKEGE